MKIELTEEQASDLAELLRGALADLSSEIAATDNAAYRDGLRPAERPSRVCRRNSVQRAGRGRAIGDLWPYSHPCPDGTIEWRGRVAP